MKKTPEKIQRVGLVANSDKPASKVLAQKAASQLVKARREVFCDIVTEQMAGLDHQSFPDLASLARAVDLLLVFGGDGTMLRVVREIDGAQTPILGVNVGRLGFLTAVPADDLTKVLEKIWASDFSLERRPLLEGTGRGGGRKILLRALNDIVISRGVAPRMIELEVCVDDDVLTCYRCDGLIISSPTGSTAYSLSAGGAIVSPAARVFAITPICPHTLSNRSVIVGMDSVIKVKVLSEKVETSATADGQVQVDLLAGDVITIGRSSRQAHLLHPGGSSFFDTLRRKLHWSGSNV